MAKRKRLLATPQVVKNIRNAQARITRQIYKATGLDKVQKAVKRFQRIVNPSYTAEHRRIWNYIRNAQKKGGTVGFDLTPITRLQEPFAAQKLRRITAAYIHSLTKYPARDAYNKERNRIKGYIQRQRKAGKEVNFTLPERPKIPTFEDVESLKQFSTDFLRERTYTPSEIAKTERVTTEETTAPTVEKQKTRRDLINDVFDLYEEGLTAEQIFYELDGAIDKHDIDLLLEGYTAATTIADDELDDEIEEQIEPPKPKRSPPRATDIILHNTYEMLNNFESLLDGWTPDDRWSDDLAEVKADDRITLRSILNGNIRAFGRDEVAQRLDENAAEIAGIIERVLYSSGSKYHNTGREGIQQDFKRLREILLSRPLTLDESKEIQSDYDENYEWFDVNI